MKALSSTLGSSARTLAGRFRLGSHLQDGELVGDRAQKLIDCANLYREKLRAGVDFLNGVPNSPAAAAEQFALRREVVESILDRIEVDADKYTHVTFVVVGSQATMNRQH